MSRRPQTHRGIRQGKIEPWPETAPEPDQLAQRVTYTGNPEHKTYRSPAGPPTPRADKAKCDQYAAERWPELLDALRLAIRAQSVSAFDDHGFPRRAWVWINDVLHEARLTNSATGDYHGFPIDDPLQYPAPPNALNLVPRVHIATN
jgi:hypothetical protein